jgi:hypothetical protein
MNYDFPSEGAERLASTPLSSQSDKNDCDKPDKSCGSWGGSRATAVVALILVIIIFVLLWCGVFGGMTQHHSRSDRDGHGHGHHGGWFSNSSIGGMLFALVIVFIIFAIMVWVVYDNPNWGVWLSAIIIIIFIILIIWAIIAAAGHCGGKKEHHKDHKDAGCKDATL